jgi:hypothetical protein
MRSDEELANRELAVSIAEAAMNFIHSTGGMDAVGIASPIDGTIAVFRGAIRRAFAIRNPAGAA